MKPIFSKIKILFVFSMVVFIIIGLVAWQKYPFGVKQYKTIKLGMSAAEKVGDSTGWAPPYNKVPEESAFYVYSLGDNTMCIGSDCGVGGYFIECLGGWISGYKDIGDVFDYGLRDAGISINEQKVITISDREGKIVGIYPGASIRNLPYVMHNHRNLVSEEVFKGCINKLPWRWK